MFNCYQDGYSDGFRDAMNGKNKNYTGFPKGRLWYLIMPMTPMWRVTTKVIGMVCVRKTKFTNENLCQITIK